MIFVLRENQTKLVFRSQHLIHREAQPRGDAVGNAALPPSGQRGRPCRAIIIRIQDIVVSWRSTFRNLLSSLILLRYRHGACPLVALSGCEYHTERTRVDIAGVAARLAKAAAVEDKVRNMVSVCVL